jgi:hypothetical protein
MQSNEDQNIELGRFILFPTNFRRGKQISWILIQQQILVAWLDHLVSSDSWKPTERQENDDPWGENLMGKRIFDGGGN